MAKLNARGTHKLCDLRSTKETESREPSSGYTERYWLFAIRSDGVVLRKYCSVNKKTSIGTYRQDGTYTIVGTISKPEHRNVEFLARIMRRLGIEPEGAACPSPTSR